jgi:hypothetical protein
MKKVAIIALVAVAILVIAIVIAQPGSKKPVNFASPPKALKWIGSLSPKVDVKAADIAGGCVVNNDTLVVTSATPCQTLLPTKPNRLRMCLVDGTLGQLVITGDKYGPQQVGAGKTTNTDSYDARCASNKLFVFDLYDEHSRLAVQCALGPACQLQIL